METSGAAGHLIESYQGVRRFYHPGTILLQILYRFVTTGSSAYGTVRYISCFEQSFSNGVKIMNADVINTIADVTEVTSTPSSKEHTLRTLFSVICADNEFSLLRRTLEIYCEEIERKIN